MFQLSASRTVYLHREPIDFRKNINGLSALVEHDLALDPFADALYVFSVNVPRTHLPIWR